MTKRFIWGWLALLISVAAYAGDGSTAVPSTIDQVTVFLHGAQVHRTAENVKLHAGENILLFTDLAPTAIEQTIQVTGGSTLTLLSVRYHLNYLQDEEKRTRILELNSAKKALQVSILLKEQAVGVLKDEHLVLTTNNNVATKAKGVQVSDLKAAADYFDEELTAIAEQQFKLENELKKMRVELTKINQQLNEWNAKASNPKGEVFVTLKAEKAMTAGFTLSYYVPQASWVPFYDVRVENISSPVSLTYKANVRQNSGEDWENVKLTLSSGDPSVSGIQPELSPWRLAFPQPVVYYTPPVVVEDKKTTPTSDTRKAPHKGNAYSVIKRNGNKVSGTMNDSDTNEELISATIEFLDDNNKRLAAVATDVDGNFSTTIPANVTRYTVSYLGYEDASGSLREGNNFFLLVPSAMEISSMVASAPKVIQTDAGLGYSATKLSADNKSLTYNWSGNEESNKLDDIPLVVTTQHKATSSEFAIELPYTILSDNKDYAVEMSTHSLPALYQYYSAPKLDPGAYLTAKVTNWESLNLLSGTVNLYFEGTYLGQSVINTDIAEDTLVFSLGKDKSIAVTRTRSQENTKRQFLGPNRTDSRGFDIEIKNNKTLPINIIIEDQVPVSVVSDIKVEDIAKGAAVHNATTGILTWKLEIPKAAAKKINFKYSVRYPKSKTVVLE